MRKKRLFAVCCLILILLTCSLSLAVVVDMESLFNLVEEKTNTLLSSSCENGTVNGECFLNNPPFRCVEGNIMKNASICGCPTSTPDICDGGCTDLSTDQNNCGGCKHKCNMGEKCINGMCTTVINLICKGNAIQCGDECIDVSTNMDHCGSCLHTCFDHNETCIGGKCRCKENMTETCEASNGCQGTRVCNSDGVWNSCETNNTKCFDGLCRLNCDPKDLFSSKSMIYCQTSLINVATGRFKCEITEDPTFSLEKIDDSDVIRLEHEGKAKMLLYFSNKNLNKTHMVLKRIGVYTTGETCLRILSDENHNGEFETEVNYTCFSNIYRYYIVSLSHLNVSNPHIFYVSPGIVEADFIGLVPDSLFLKSNFNYYSCSNTEYIDSYVGEIYCKAIVDETSKISIDDGSGYIIDSAQLNPVFFKPPKSLTQLSFKGKTQSDGETCVVVKANQNDINLYEINVRKECAWGKDSEISVNIDDVSIYNSFMFVVEKGSFLLDYTGGEEVVEVIASLTPTPNIGVSPTLFPTNITITPIPSMEITATPTVTQEPEPTSVIKATPTPTPTPTIAPTEIPQVTPEITSLPTPTEIVTPPPTATPITIKVPTPSPTKIPVDKKEEFRLKLADAKRLVVQVENKASKDKIQQLIDESESLSIDEDYVNALETIQNAIDTAEVEINTSKQESSISSQTIIIILFVVLFLAVVGFIGYKKATAPSELRKKIFSAPAAPPTDYAKPTNEQVDVYSPYLKAQQKPTLFSYSYGADYYSARDDEQQTTTQQQQYDPNYYWPQQQYAQTQQYGQQQTDQQQSGQQYHKTQQDE